MADAMWVRLVKNRKLFFQHFISFWRLQVLDVDSTVCTWSELWAILVKEVFFVWSINVITKPPLLSLKSSLSQVEIKSTWYSLIIYIYTVCIPFNIMMIFRGAVMRKVCSQKFRWDEYGGVTAFKGLTETGSRTMGTRGSGCFVCTRHEGFETEKWVLGDSQCFYWNGTCPW